ncbi:uncharacterized protein MKZ38_010075 [Zalerion maritima]|uniref:BTB domain-containing protein n=1 Tax=Zalerion maritima TaxID=339359 RepID=A0AAD5RSU2_9PEZI|nr:uncharacterized protein MKZ38_010075 [Zalerion maritima]
MFKRSFRSQEAGSSSSHRVDKSSRLKKRDAQKLAKLQRSFTEESLASAAKKSLAPSPIVTLTVGREGRLFAAHEDVLRQSPFFDQAVNNSLYNGQPQTNKRISLPDEEPEVFSAVLEYLYKGDYYPRLIHNKHRNSWELEDSSSALTPVLNQQSTHISPVPGTPRGGGGRATAVEPTIFMSEEGTHLLRDTVVYCAADRYGLEELKRLALRKQGLQSGIDVATILRSATYAYAHTPDSDSRLRAHYLALIIRCRKTFKRSGTMQAEMERGGSKLFFDLFVAMCNHLDDVVDATNARTPRTV